MMERAGPSGPIIGPGSEFWEEIPVTQGLVHPNSSQLALPLVSVLTAAGNVGGFNASIPQPPTPSGFKAQIVDIAQSFGGADDTANTYIPGFIVYTDAGDGGAGSPTGQGRFGSSLPFDGDQRNVLLASEGTIGLGELPLDFPTNGSAMTIYFSLDNNQGYTLTVYQWKFRVKWRFVKA